MISRDELQNTIFPNLLATAGHHRSLLGSKQLLFHQLHQMPYNCNIVNKSLKTVSKLLLRPEKIKTIHCLECTLAQDFIKLLHRKNKKTLTFFLIFHYILEGKKGIAQLLVAQIFVLNVKDFTSKCNFMLSQLLHL